MRTITIRRKKSFVGCACKVFIYTIDSIPDDGKIEKSECTLLGSIKNGSFLEIEITDNKTVLLAVYDNLGVFMITDILIIPEGSNDLVIDGKTRLNPSKGNPFIFD